MDTFVAPHQSEMETRMADEPLAYRLITGTDDRAFCERVSEALATGYQLYGGPAITHDGERTVVAQAIVLAGSP